MSGIARKLIGASASTATSAIKADYPLTNTATDPTNPFWRNNEGQRVGYVFVPNEGIYTNEPITDMTAMFLSSHINDPDLAGWDVSSVTNMNSVFLFASSFNQDIGGWDVSSVTNMSSMFRSASAMTFPLGSWQTNLAVQPPSFSLDANATFQSYRGTADFPLLADGTTRINT